MDVHVYSDYQDFLEKNPDALGKMYFATTKAHKVYSEVDYEPDCYLMFGKESAGIPEEILVENEDHCVRIPMWGEIRSLNLSNSVAVVLYEALRHNDFEKMADNYNEDANYVEELVTDFSAASEQLLASVSGVVANIQEVTKAANDGAASTGSIAERVTNVDRQAEDMRVLMKQTQEASLMLRKDTKKFTVA